MATLRDFGLTVNTDDGRANILADQDIAAGMGSLRRGWESGRIGTELNPLRTQALDAKIAGDAQRQAELDAQVSALEQRQQMYAPRVSDLRDINGIGDGTDWFAGQVGQGAASMVDPMAVSAGLGVVGRVAGAVPHPIAKGIGLAAQAGQFAVPWMMGKEQMTGEFIGEAQHDKELMANTSPQGLRDMAGNYGVVAGGLDSAFPGMVGRQLTGLSRAGSTVARQSALGAGAKFGLNNLSEGATEGAQAAGSQYARGLLNPNRDTSEDNWDIANNVAGGMVGGSPFSAAGALAEAGHNRIDGGVDAVKGKAGEVVDLLNANPTVQEVKEAGKKWWQSGKESVIDLQAAVADENGNITPSSVAGAAKGAVDVGMGKANRAAATEEFWNAMSGQMPPEMAADVSPVGAAQQEAWVKAHDERRATAVVSMLETMKDDPKAQELLKGVSEADPVNRHIALTQAGGYVVDRMEQDSLAEEAGVAKENNAAKLVGALGGLAGRAAMGVGKTAFEFGKAALSGAKEGMGRKKNMQIAGVEFTPYEDWRERTGRGQLEIRGSAGERALNEANSAQTGPAKPEAIKQQQAMEKSYRRAQLFGEKLASVTKRNLSVEIGDYMRDVGFEIADLAESWGMTEGAGQPVTVAPRMQGKGLELNLSNIANSMRVALGKGAIPVLDQLQSLADPKSVPMFDILRKHLQVGSTPEAREERKVLRATVADQVLMLLPPEQAKMILEDTSDPEVSGPEQLLRSIERMGRGHLSRDQRIAITKAVGGKGVLKEMLQTVGAIAEPETVVGSIVDDRAQSGEENFEQNGDDEADTTDFETRAQEKNVSKGVGGKVYGFHASPNLRTSNERRDPFSATEKLSPNDIAARELLGESTMMRPKLFTKGQKLFGGKSAIEKKVADTRAQLAGDPAYPDHANYDVRSKSAHEVMKDMNMQPGKVLQLFRDYAGEEEGAMGQAAAMARFVIVRSMRLDALRKAKLNGEPTPTFAPFKNPALKAAEASYNARFKDMRDGGQLDENVNYARVEFDKIVRAELNETAEMYFKDRFMVVGEKLSNQDADQIALPTILDMHRHGQTLVEQSRVGDAADGSKAVLLKDMAYKKLSEANVLMFKTKSGGRSKEFAIPAGDLVNWVRQQRGKTEAADSEDSGESFSNRSKDDEYLEDLSHGIASLIGSGHVQGMPYKINAKGWVEKFSKGIPDSLMLATTTYGAKKFGDEQRRSKQVPKSAEGLQTVGNADYDAEVAADVNKNAEFFSPDDRAERDLVVDDKRTKPRKAMSEQRASDAGTQLVTREHTTEGEVTGEVVMPDGKKRIETFVSDGKGGYKIKERTAYRTDVSGEVAADSKTDDPHKTPLDFVGKQKSGEVADERSNQRWLSRQTGASTDMSPGPEPKARAASRAKFRADEIMAVMNKDVEAGTEMIAARLRAARAPEYNENKPARGKMTVPGVKGEDQVVGGAHYVAPLAYLANAGRVAQMNLSESEKEMFTDLRKQVAQTLLESNLSGMNKLAIARLMSEKPEALTAQNLDARLARIVGGVAEGKALGAKQEKVGPTAEDRIANDNFDGLDTVAKVDKFLKDAYAAWRNGADNRDVQAHLNRMFDEGNFASTDLASFYDGLKGGNAELDHDGILAALKSAPEVANAGLPKGVATLSGGSERKLNAQDATSKVSTQAERDAAVAYAKKVLGPQIKVDFQDITGYSGEFIEATNTIVISTTAAAGTLNTLYHEALHKFFKDFVKGNPKVQAMFETLINDLKHLAKLRALLDGYPAAQAQLTSGEERLAYTYQFWKAGLLEVDAKASTWLQKLGKFFRRVAGRVRDSERALELFEAFDAGKMSEPSAAGMVIAKAMAKGTATLKFRRKMDAMFQGLAALTVPSAEILGMSVSPTARKLSTMFFTNPGEEAHGSEEIGLLNARRSAAQQYVNTSNRRFEGMSQMDKEQVQEHLQKETPLDKIAYAEHREAVKDIRQLLERFHKYMVDAGMGIGKIENYYPVVWNVDRVLANKAKFINMLVTKYAAELAPADGDVQKAAERIYASLISKDGIDKHLPAQREDGVLNPFFASQEMRTMPWLKAEDRAEYLEKDMPMTLTRYFNQGVHAAEYRRRFGKNGIKLEKMLATINEELSAAGKEMLRRGEFKDEAARVKWVGRQMRDVVQATGAMEGSLGKDVSPNMRKFNSWMTVYQNVRLLPMALFSSFVDPLALVARGAPFKAAYETFVYSMREVFRNWGDAFKDMPPVRQKDEWRQLSELIGASEIAVFQHQVSGLYASTYMTPGAKKINDKMFTFNGMEAWNRGTRIMATKWAVRFLEQHAGVPDKNHSARWLKELGLTPAMITLDDGKLVTTPQQLMALKGITLDEARAQIAPIHAALNRWVEGAVLTPNAAQRPSWGSDPNFATMFHLKQFSYSFHQTILKRAANEFNHGNVAPLAALAAFIPTMIGADIMKGLIQGGGSLPPYMAGMNAGDWVMHATQRAGLHGIGVIGVDAANDWASLGGPAFEQIVDAGRDGFGSKSALNALPLHSLYGQLAQ